MEYKFIEPADKNIFEQRFLECGYSISEFSFTNMYMWRRAYALKWCEEHETLIIKGTWNGQEFYFCPAGTPENVVAAVQKLKMTHTEVQFRSVSAEALMLLRQNIGEFRSVAAEADYDYVYSVDELSVLAGRKYEKKRHHINKLLRLYPDVEYRKLDATLFEKVIAHTEHWYDSTLSDDIWLKYERQAICDVLANWQKLDVKGAVLLINDRVVAFTVGEQLSNDSVVIHIEKADTDYDGVYQLINREFLRREWSSFKYVNREEDMGIPRLRIAKQSYCPVKMLEKHVVDISNGEIL